MERCGYCKKTIIKEKKEQIYFYNGINITFCQKECFQRFLENTKENEERNFLYSTICRIFNIEKISGKLFAEIKRVKEEYNLTYKQISAILHYIYDIKQNKVYSPTLFYVGSYIKEAKEYYEKLKNREENAQKNIEKISQLPTRIVKPNYNYRNKKNNGLKINPENIL